MKTWEVVIVFAVLALVIYEALKQVFATSTLGTPSAASLGISPAQASALLGQSTQELVSQDEQENFIAQQLQQAGQTPNTSLSYLPTSTSSGYGPDPFSY